MGYTTNFSGKFDLNKKLDAETHALLEGLAATRRMKRRITGFGVEGEFYCADLKDFGQTETDDVIDANTPPSTQPSLWLQWIPSEDGMSIHWDGGEKFYSYVEWIKYLMEKILIPRGYELSGQVRYEGEDEDDFGTITIKKNIVALKKGKRVW